MEEVQDHRCWLTDVVVAACSREVSSDGCSRRIIYVSFQKLTKTWCDIVLFVRYNHVMLKEFVMEIFRIKFVHEWKYG